MVVNACRNEKLQFEGEIVKIKTFEKKSKQARNKVSLILPSFWLVIFFKVGGCFVLRVYRNVTLRNRYLTAAIYNNFIIYLHTDWDPVFGIAKFRAEIGFTKDRYCLNKKYRDFEI